MNSFMIERLCFFSCLKQILPITDNKSISFLASKKDIMHLKIVPILLKVNTSTLTNTSSFN